ncbi:hypothetical protein B9Z55_015817 [Caenorhabditis nigoni]|uniref:Uncharacterized protein n=1 Tax=Caenorhabditis nigoni TaxID=1611254 RepID=A0A2G5UBV2_9PELO|nr:hypothetical protein B9Z55_015817 [Caenorhabditis nigoni]
MKLLLIFLTFLSIFRQFSNGFPVKKLAENLSNPDNRGVLPNSRFLNFLNSRQISIFRKFKFLAVDGVYCRNSDFQAAIYSALTNVTNPDTASVDQIQGKLENTLMPKFKALGGTWLVSVTTYHRVNGWVDDSAIGMNTFCAVNAVSLNLYIIIMKIDSLS